MNCRKNRSLISAYLDQELPGAEMLSVREHMRECPECRDELDEMRDLKQMLGAMKTVAPRPEFEERLFATVCARKSRRTYVASLATMVAAAAAAAALAFVLFGRTGQPGLSPTDVDGGETLASDSLYSDPFGEHVPTVPAGFPSGE